MKYRKITFKNHPILGSVSFDFTDAQGKTVDTIFRAKGDRPQWHYSDCTYCV